MLRCLLIGALLAPAGGAKAQVSRVADVKSARSFVYHGKIVRPDGSSPTGSMSVNLKILSPDPKLCVLWSETQVVAMKDGGFSIELGHGVNRLPGASGGAAGDFKQAFVNNPGLTISGAQCATGNSYTPTSSDDRLLTATFNDSGSVIEIAGLPIKSVPFALQAEELAGYGIANLMKIDGAGSSVTFSSAETQTLKDILGGNIFFDMKARAVKNVAAPVDPNDAATKAFVEAHVASSMVGAGLGTVTNVSVAGGALSVSNGSSTPQVSLPQASTSVSGYLSSTDWNTFNGKQPAGAYLTSVPNLDASILTTGTLGVARGGTGIAPTMAEANKVYGVSAGGSSAEFKSITGGTGISVAHSAGTIQISATGAGTVTGVGVGGQPLTVTGTASPVISITQANTTTAGYLSAADWNTFNSKQPAGAYLTSVSAANVTTALGFSPLSSSLAQHQVYLGDGSNVAAASFFGIAQMRNNIGAAQFPAACGAHQTLVWSAITDVLVCSNINNLDANKITSGTIAVARLGSGTADATTYLRGDGTWQPIAAGSDNLGNHTATANLNLGTHKLVGNGGSSGLTVDASGNVGIGTASPVQALEIAGGLRIGNSSTPCNASTEGSIRYNSSSKRMEFCNATSWQQFSQGVNVSLVLSGPSTPLVKAGPLTFTATYGSGADTNTITLATGDIVFSGAGAAGCVAAISGSGLTRTVTVNSCTGTGAVAISVVENTAQSTTGNSAPTAGPSTAFQADNSGPNAVTGFSLGAVPSNLSSTPTLSYTATTDVGAGTVSSYQAQVKRVSDNAVITAWTTHSSGTALSTGVTLAPNTGYYFEVRALDSLGNIGAVATSPSWTSVAQIQIMTAGAGRTWTDGSSAASCNAYRNPSGIYVYVGVTGDGVYTIDPDGSGGAAPFNAYCDMTTSGGGWTAIVSAQNLAVNSTIYGNFVKTGGGTVSSNKMYSWYTGSVYQNHSVAIPAELVFTEAAVRDVAGWTNDNNCGYSMLYFTCSGSTYYWGYTAYDSSSRTGVHGGTLVDGVVSGAYGTSTCSGVNSKTMYYSACRPGTMGEVFVR